MAIDKLANTKANRVDAHAIENLGPELGKFMVFFGIDYWLFEFETKLGRFFRVWCSRGERLGDLVIYQSRSR